MQPADAERMPLELRPDELFRPCDPRDLPFETTADEPVPTEALGQTRAIDAARLAIGIRHDGYNLFAIGPHGVGKAPILRKLLEEEAARRPTPADWCHVNNFADPRRPHALRVPAGTARQLRGDMARLVDELRIAMPTAFDSDEYRSRKRRLAQDFQHRQDTAFSELQQRAHDQSVGVMRTESGFAVAALRGNDVIESQAFTQLPAQEQATRSAAIDRVGTELTTLMQSFRAWAREQLEAFKMLDRETATAVAHHALGSLRERYRDLEGVIAYLNEVEQDVIDTAERFLERPEDEAPDVALRALHARDDGDPFRRYAVNVMVDHTDRHGAPVICEHNPTHANVTGHIEQVSELGALLTDFTLIRPGALHRANGGYLVLDASKLLAQPLAWDGLKRALRTRELRVVSVAQALGIPSTVSIEPEPIPLDLKVVLVGDRLLYYLLATYDSELDDLFKVMADFAEDIARDRDADVSYARLIAGLVRQHGLCAFDRGAVARVIEQASRLASDGEKLSLHTRPIVDLLVEAEHHALTAGRSLVTAAEVQAALDNQRHRAGRIRERVLEMIRRKALLIDTSGEVVGQINALVVVDFAGHAFGHPTRLTACARLGGGEVIDIEREVELGGPIHAKGVMILAGLLGTRYVPHLPLSLSATIVFEQSYAGVEGDSASLAELCALLSAIAEVPIKQAIAVTGSVNQRGELQPISGINEKIEGFFEVCAQRGLTGAQGVVLPRANVSHLMLRADVAAAVRAGKFHVYAAATVDEALELVTGRAAGVRDTDGRFSAGSVNAAVEARLTAFADDTRRFLNGPERPTAVARLHRWS